MRILAAALFTVVLIAPSLVDTVAGRISIDGFGVRFLAAVAFATLATSLIAVFLRATEPQITPDAEPDPGPGRRKTDAAPTPPANAA